MKVISSDLGGDWKKLLIFLLHGGVNCRVDRPRFGLQRYWAAHRSGCRLEVPDKNPGTSGETDRRFCTGYLPGEVLFSRSDMWRFHQQEGIHSSSVGYPC